MAREQRDWYDTPLYYDIIFDADTIKEAAFLEGVWERFGSGKKKGRVLEAACGSGRVMAEMLKRGWKADGFDLSEAMLGHARMRLKGATGWKVWQAEMARFEVPERRRYQVVHCLVSTFKYLLSEVEAQAALVRMAGVLEPGGLLVLGLHLTDYGRTGCEHERWVEERAGVRVVCNTRTWPADKRTRLERVRARLKVTVTEQGETKEQETNWAFRTYNAAQLKALLRVVPELDRVACYDFHYDLGAERKLDDRYADVIVVLRKTAQVGG
jgi:SAM-dependent methyltransferase